MCKGYMCILRNSWKSFTKKHFTVTRLYLLFFSLGLWWVFYFIVIVASTYFISVSWVLFEGGWGIHFHYTGKKNDPWSIRSGWLEVLKVIPRVGFSLWWYIFKSSDKNKRIFYTFLPTFLYRFLILCLFSCCD